LGAAAAGAVHDVVERDSQGCGLAEDLGGARGVAVPAERVVGGSARDEVGPAALLAQLLGEGVQLAGVARSRVAR
jgi:hypothetical protein